jgi:hypothetical protein
MRSSSRTWVRALAYVVSRFFGAVGTRINWACFPQKMAKTWRTEVNIMIRKHSEELLAQREVATAADPFEVKGLALTYKITPAQVRALLLKCGRDWLQFDRAAAELRRQ